MKPPFCCLHNSIAHPIQRQAQFTMKIRWFVSIESELFAGVSESGLPNASARGMEVA